MSAINCGLQKLKLIYAITFFFVFIYICLIEKYISQIVKRETITNALILYEIINFSNAVLPRFGNSSLSYQFLSYQFF